MLSTCPAPLGASAVNEQQRLYYPALIVLPVPGSMQVPVMPSVGKKAEAFLVPLHAVPEDEATQWHEGLAQPG